MVPSKPIIYSVSEDILVRYEGEMVVLEHCGSEVVCESPEQLSELGFQWSKRNWNARKLEKITPGGRFEVNHNGSLTIMDARSSDSGLYQVNVSINGQGSALHHTIQSLLIVDVASHRVHRRFYKIGFNLRGEYIPDMENKMSVGQQTRSRLLNINPNIHHTLKFLYTSLQ